LEKFKKEPTGVHLETVVRKDHLINRERKFEDARCRVRQ